MKKIIKTPWNVIQLLYCNEEQIRNPGNPTSNRIIIDKENPIDPPNHPIKIYTAPINIWLVEYKIELFIDNNEFMIRII